MTFAQWLESVETHLQQMHRASLYNIPSTSFQDLRTLYEEGRSPKESANNVVTCFPMRYEVPIPATSSMQHYH